MVSSTGCQDLLPSIAKAVYGPPKNTKNFAGLYKNYSTLKVFLKITYFCIIYKKKVLGPFLIKQNLPGNQVSRNDRM